MWSERIWSIRTITRHTKGRNKHNGFSSMRSPFTAPCFKYFSSFLLLLVQIGTARGNKKNRHVGSERSAYAQPCFFSTKVAVCASSTSSSKFWHFFPPSSSFLASPLSGVGEGGSLGVKMQSSQLLSHQARTHLTRSHEAKKPLEERRRRRRRQRRRNSGRKRRKGGDMSSS